MTTRVKADIPTLAVRAIPAIQTEEIKDMIWKKHILLIILTLSTSICFGQGKVGPMNGKVTFLTSNSVYVKFENTENIFVGDTLQLYGEGTLNPCLIVKNKSSTTCVCFSINGCEAKIEDLIVHQPKKVVNEPRGVLEDKPDVADQDQAKLKVKPKLAEEIRGSISAASYSNLSSVRANTHRTMYRLSLNASHINNSKFSVETYMNYRQNFTSNQSSSNLRKNAYNIYNLAVQYDVDSTFSIVIGRKINRYASSLGAIDGVQAEKFFGHFYTGIMAGFRPDIIDYGFNSNLLQYGGYIGLKTEDKRFYSQSTLGLLEQKNTGHIDRRYTYFQHSSTIYDKINVFSSFEIDLYQRVNGVASSSARLTNLFLSAGYRMSSKVNVNVAYDSRKRILFYETLKTQIEQLLDDDISRQGLRVRVNVRPYKYITTGLSYSKRFQSNSLNESDNLNAFFSMSKVPYVGGRLSININSNVSNYLDSKIVSFRHSRTLLDNKLNVDFYLRMVDYSYVNREINSKGQQYYGAGLSYNLGKKLAFSVLGELATRDVENNYRINTRISKRF